MIEIDVQRYGSALAPLLRPRAMTLIVGRPNESARAQLDELTTATAFAPHRITNLDMANAALAGLWLYHDYFEQSHNISQDLATSTGSYWHAILHRREPDYYNAKYWFARVGQHPIYKSLRIDAAELARHSEVPQVEFTLREPWDPTAFVDLCEQAVGTGTSMEMLAEQVQRAEWWMLFDYCYRHAIGQ